MSELRLAGRIARAFIDSPLTPLIIAASVVLGLAALWALPREEEPQIIVPMVDIFVAMAGASAAEVEQRVTGPMERLLWEIPGVEYIYSTSSPGQALAVVRFEVGQDEEDSLVKLFNKLASHFDLIPPGASQPLIKPRSIDDVPFLTLTLSGEHHDGYELRRIAAQLASGIKSLPDVSEITLIGGQRRALRIELDPLELAARGLSAAALAQHLRANNSGQLAGQLIQGGSAMQVEVDGFLRSAADLEAVVVGTGGGRPIFLGDVARVHDGPEEPASYVWHVPGPAAETGSVGRAYSAVTIALAKRKGTNAVTLADAVLEYVAGAERSWLPATVQVIVTRNYGETAADKSNELLLHMGIAIVSVTLLILFALGRREALIVAVAIPVTLALTLAVFYLYGYTLNRITLFALIFSIGILVDDAIVVVENIVRHVRLPSSRGRPLAQIAVEAVDEVGNPTILATLAVIAAILPMAFVGGLMGPYMRPIPVGAGAAMLFSLLVAFVVTPWASIRILKRGVSPRTPPGASRPILRQDPDSAPSQPDQASSSNVHDGLKRGVSPRTPPAAGSGQANPESDGAHGEEGEGRLTRLYRRVMDPLLARARNRRLFLLGIVAVLLLACALVPLKAVVVKMLPFDNKSELQVLLDLPEGTPLEQTMTVARAAGAGIEAVPEVTHYQIYVGTAAPYSFNGLVRHYFLRQAPELADIQVNLTKRHDRDRQSHAIARDLRDRIQPIADRFGARLKVVEVPPGPPVLSTLVAEVYAPDSEERVRIAEQVRAIFESTEGVVDIDWYREDDYPRLRLVADHAKAGSLGVTTSALTDMTELALSGRELGLLHLPQEQEDVPLWLQLPRAHRSAPQDLLALPIPTALGAAVPLGELARFEPDHGDKSIYHKNLQRVIYVTAEVAGREESPVYPILKMSRRIDAIELDGGRRIEQLTAALSSDPAAVALKWDGEWHITYEVFRDLGLAFAAVLVLIYILVVAWFGSFVTPIVIMAAIPFSLVGILPAHAALGAFFTATSMIGFIAGAGIVVRNSIILVDFIELRRAQGMALREAVIDAGAVRFRPMMLTAAAVIVGASVILFDPIFQGLALSLMAGEVASLLLSRMAVPVLYFIAGRKM
ncbi:MAG TPA: efflux RND transporter permease subunit [Acidobacteriota bacterium]